MHMKVKVFLGFYFSQNRLTGSNENHNYVRNVTYASSSLSKFLTLIYKQIILLTYYLIIGFIIKPLTIKKQSAGLCRVNKNFSQFKISIDKTARKTMHFL